MRSRRVRLTAPLLTSLAAMLQRTKQAVLPLALQLTDQLPAQQTWIQLPLHQQQHLQQQLSSRGRTARLCISSYTAVGFTWACQLITAKPQLREADPQLMAVKPLLKAVGPQLRMADPKPPALQLL